MTQMGGQYRSRVDDRIAQSLGLLTLIIFYPYRIQTKGGILDFQPTDASVNMPWINRQQTLRMDFGFADGYAQEADPVTVGR